MADWDEDSHPRDDKGRFGGGGGGSSLKEYAAKKTRSPESIMHEIPGLPKAAPAAPRAAGAAKSADKLAPRTWTHELPHGMAEQTWKAHFDADPDKGGKPTAERAKTVHDPIIKKALDVPPVPKGEPKIAVFTMGAPASGKSSGLRNIDTRQFVQVAPDDIKDQIPEYQKVTKDRNNTYRNAAHMAHEESTYIGKQILKGAIDKGTHVVVDGTGINADSMMKKMKDLKAAGYHIHLVMSHLNEAEGHRRAEGRAEETGRLVPHKVTSEGYKKVPKNFEKISKMADTFQVMDSRKGNPATGKPTPVAWSKDVHGEHHHHDSLFVRAFKRTHGWTED
jgi:predicted ABC-type ATPase